MLVELYTYTDSHRLEMVLRNDFLTLQWYKGMHIQ